MPGNASALPQKNASGCEIDTSKSFQKIRCHLSGKYRLSGNHCGAMHHAGGGVEGTALLCAFLSGLQGLKSGCTPNPSAKSRSYTLESRNELQTGFLKDEGITKHS